MIDDVHAARSAEDILLIEDLRELALDEFGGADVIANMLASSPDTSLDDVDPDWIQVLADTVRVLTSLCGSQGAAFRWLFHSDSYRKVAGCEPYYCLEQGHFWSMAMMLDWLRIIDKYRPTDLVQELFHTGHDPA